VPPAPAATMPSLLIQGDIRLRVDSVVRNDVPVTVDGAVTGDLRLTKDGPGPRATALAGCGLEVAGGTVTPTAAADNRVSLLIVDVGQAARLDLSTGSLRVGSATGVAQLREYLSDGYDGGKWDGPGIVTSASAGGFGIGYATDASGVTSLTYALSGDADLNGKVDFGDLLRVAQNSGKPADAVWTQGDFDYNAKVDFADLLKLAQNFGRTRVRAAR
jgi:hypothetical protein